MAAEVKSSMAVKEKGAAVKEKEHRFVVVVLYN